MKWKANKNKVCIDTNSYVWYKYFPYRNAVRIYNALKTARARYGTGDFLNLHCRIGITEHIPTSSAMIILKIPWGFSLAQWEYLKKMSAMIVGMFYFAHVATKR